MVVACPCFAAVEVVRCSCYLLDSRECLPQQQQLDCEMRRSASKTPEPSQPLAVTAGSFIYSRSWQSCDSSSHRCRTSNHRRGMERYRHGLYDQSASRSSDSMHDAHQKIHLPCCPSHRSLLASGAHPSSLDDHSRRHMDSCHSLIDHMEQAVGSWLDKSSGSTQCGVESCWTTRQHSAIYRDAHDSPKTTRWTCPITWTRSILRRRERSKQRWSARRLLSSRTIENLHVELVSVDTSVAVLFVSFGTYPR